MIDLRTLLVYVFASPSTTLNGLEWVWLRPFCVGHAMLFLVVRPRGLGLRLVHLGIRILPALC